MTPRKHAEGSRLPSFVSEWQGLVGTRLSARARTLEFTLLSRVTNIPTLDRDIAETTGNYVKQLEVMQVAGSKDKWKKKNSPLPFCGAFSWCPSPQAR